MDGRTAVGLLDGHFHDSEIVFKVNQTKLACSSTSPLSLYVYFFSPKATVICDSVHCSSLCNRKYVIVTVGCFGVLCTLSLSVHPTTAALFSGPFAPGLYLLLSLTVMKPAFEERGAGSEASQIRSVERLVG